MYDELVKDLREWPRICVEYTGSLDELHDKAADAIEELVGKTDTFKWIPVTERLPDGGERVLCYCRANIYEVMKMRTDGDWVHNDKVYDSAYMSGFVTHWMPLPEPPKEE